MDWLWTWSGKCFGYREGDDLWTHDGRHVGRFVGDDVYGPEGRYLGQLMNDKLIRNTGKTSWQHSGFTPYGRRGMLGKFGDYAGFAMYAGHEDFPAL